MADLGAAADEIGRLRRILRQVVMLASEIPKLTDVELWDRLLVLAELCAQLLVLGGSVTKARSSGVETL